MILSVTVNIELITEQGMILTIAINIELILRCLPQYNPPKVIIFKVMLIFLDEESYEVPERDCTLTQLLQLTEQDMFLYQFYLGSTLLDPNVDLSQSGISEGDLLRREQVRTVQEWLDLCLVQSDVTAFRSIPAAFPSRR